MMIFEIPSRLNLNELKEEPEYVQTRDYPQLWSVSKKSYNKILY
jgi:hypothetical protein